MIECEHCEKRISKGNRRRICPDCGYIMNVIPLVNNEFENVDDAGNFEPVKGNTNGYR